MAYVDSVVRNGDDESGQVIVLTGFLVAIAIVVVAVTLNSLIFAQDLSTRDDGLDDREILGFEENTERMATGLAHDIGHNSSGNITQDDLFGADDDMEDDVEDNYVSGVEAYAENATVHVQNRQGIAEIEDINMNRAVWSVGQEFGEFQNESGDTEFSILDDDDIDEEVVQSLELYIEDPFTFNLFGSDESFRISAYEDRLPPQAAASQEGAAWELAFEEEGFFGDDNINVTRNVTGTADSSIITDSNITGADNLTIEIDLRDSNQACIRIDAGECDDSYEDDLEPDWLEDDVESITIQNFEERSGTYEIRLDGEGVDGEDIVLCENNAPCVKEPPEDFNLHAVGVVDDGSFTYSYTDADTEYTRTISGIRAEQDGLPLEVVDE